MALFGTPFPVPFFFLVSSESTLPEIATKIFASKQDFRHLRYGIIDSDLKPAHIVCQTGYDTHSVNDHF